MRFDPLGPSEAGEMPKDSPPGEVTPDDRIIENIRQGKIRMTDFAAKAQAMARRYRDQSGIFITDTDEGETRSSPVGEVNLMAVNIRQKVAALTINYPDWVVTAQKPENAEMTREWLREQWRVKQIDRVTNAVSTDRYVTGMGFAFYQWDAKLGPIIEQVKAADLIIDPNVMDATWMMPRFAGRIIRIPLEEAKARYNTTDITGYTDSRMPGYSISTKLPRPVEVILYYDEDTEAEVIGDKVYRSGPNLYGTVPLLVMQGEYNPLGPFGLGDYDIALGAAEAHRLLMSILLRTARHGGGTPWVRADLVGPDVVAEVLNGTYQGIVPISGASGDEVMGFTQIMPISEAVLESIREVGAAVDADQAVNQYQRGSVVRDPGLATTAALEVSSGGARSAAGRRQVEVFVSAIARAFVTMAQKWAQDSRVAEVGEDEDLVWEAILDADDVRVIEESAGWKDPAADQSASIALANLALQAYPVFLQAAQVGVSSVIPNLQAYFDDVLRAFGKKVTAGYWTGMMAQPPMGMEGPDVPPQDGAPQGAPPAGVEQTQQQTALPPGVALGGLAGNQAMQQGAEQNAPR